MAGNEPVGSHDGEGTMEKTASAVVTGCLVVVAVAVVMVVGFLIAMAVLAGALSGGKTP